MFVSLVKVLDMCVHVTSSEPPLNVPKTPPPGGPVVLPPADVTTPEVENPPPDDTTPGSSYRSTASPGAQGR